MKLSNLLAPLVYTPCKLSLRVLLSLSLVTLLTVTSLAQVNGLHAQTPEPPEGSYSESQAQGIDRMIMCPVCPAETIDQAQVEISFQMRAVVREMLADGKERDEILAFFVERYGKDILAAPPKTGANLVAWLAPVGGFGAGLVAVFLIIRSMSRQRPALVTAQPVQDAGLIPYLELVDRHLDLTRGGTSNQPSYSVESRGTDVPEQSEGQTGKEGKG
ncbi:MAG: cytochrome c-type biogenesis protein CcmH [Dehalococcoidia bacterium]|uniref:CcmH/CycL/Ccl2/NrfF N-terminal domain-containing protein n=1 Tax=marine metagenome TaxID=408172 RepID=A0A381PSQ4_9ZZZZ|nr:cytochrome c-type biogenesis protein CcmH [Dehalococcoidia bacterium]MEC9289618.1 cytochrome c-type biogenesis protein [Chloroflexota bacterium]MED5587238.1 cytochrome c-type biogenesis protein [Chloroflexota bacterium]